MVQCCICNFFKRSFLYQILIIIAALKLKNAWRYNKEFVKRIGDFLSSINLPENLLNYLPKNNEYTHKGFLISLIVFASFSMLGVNFFKVLSSIGCILLAFLYHNPIKKKESYLQAGLVPACILLQRELVNNCCQYTTSRWCITPFRL